MDPQLPAQLVEFLAPFLPYILKGVSLAGQEAAKKLGEKAGEQSLDHAKALWEKLRPKVEAKPAALEAVQDAAAHPDDEDARAALRLQLKKLLAEDESLAQELARLLEQSRPADLARRLLPAPIALQRKEVGVKSVLNYRSS